ncbi:MAG TPA: cysteine desulfurase NifS [Candidatus Magasanikbacteria bacterium]|nr:cysteine desulfurase NifS [Candidatus Magasanikbacteria bacterium]
MKFPEKPKVKRDVYLDHAATTYVAPEVRAVIEPYFEKAFGNASSLYKLGREAREAVEQARKTVAHILNASPVEIIFTSGGTESINTALFGIAHKHKEHGKHIISCGIEHHAVLHALDALRADGFEITLVPVDEHGFVDPTDVVKALRPDTILVTIMYANNEVGTVEPITEIGRKILKWRKENKTVYPFFHTDACQAGGVLDLNVEQMHVDLMTLNGSKIYGPKGVGILYKRRTVALRPLIVGGGQEMHVRAGTENVPGIVGFAKALELAQNNKQEENMRLSQLRAYFWERIVAEIFDVKLNGPELGGLRLPNNLNVGFNGIEGEALVFYIDEYGVSASTGSACTSADAEPSHVMRAMGLSFDRISSSVRFTMGKRTTREDIDYVMQYLPGVVAGLRESFIFQKGNHKKVAS